MSEDLVRLTDPYEEPPFRCHGDAFGPRSRLRRSLSTQSPPYGLRSTIAGALRDWFGLSVVTLLVALAVLA